mgnify:CR=1 FL=1
MSSKINNNQTAFLLKARHMASWQLNKLAHNSDLPCTATLPALQRGAVWKPAQVEALWDSLLRGFPIGAFLLAPYSEERGKQKFIFQKAMDLQDTNNISIYHLLDGQQRCNAITLGFLNLWQNPGQNVPAALWVDLVPPEPRDERNFIFRVVTKSHPWGYRLNTPTKRLEAKHRREALAAYRNANSSASLKSKDSFSPGQIDLSLVWPWDAKAPVPFPFLIEAVISESQDVWDLLRDKLEKWLAYWSEVEELPSLHGNCKNEVEKLLNNPTLHMDSIVEGIRRIEGTAKEMPSVLIPALILPKYVVIGQDDFGKIDQEAKEDNPDPSLQQDPIETLFIRVNSAGTPLAGEELIYSILKSIWPESQGYVESLSSRFITPARLLMLLSRLILARTDKGRERAPAPPDVGRFRRLIHVRDSQCPDFRQRLKEFFETGEAERLLQSARKLLVGPESEKPFLLPPVLAADMARKTPPEAFFFFCYGLIKHSRPASILRKFALTNTKG